MSRIAVKDRRGGKYEAAIEFTYGECERLPYNILRRLRADLKPAADGGLVAVANFNIRKPDESAAFLEMLDMFGEEGSFVHGSAADPAVLTLKTAPGTEPDEDDPDEDDMVEEDGGDDDLEIESTLNNG